MAVLEKAKLGIVDGTNVIKEEEVQFNPATLHLTLKNVHDAGENEGRQARQFVGSNAERYNLDLEFDTADEGESGQPVSVRKRTEIVERYLRPSSNTNQPPRLRFTWGDLVIEGVVESINLDFDHFASNGVPLRAKASVVLRRQDLTHEIRKAPNVGNQQRPGDLGFGLPGGVRAGFGVGSRVAAALGGEAPAEFATRLGLDPAAWRGLEFDLDAADAGLTMLAGADIGFSSNFGAGVGIGVHVGFEAGVSASLEAEFGLAPEVTVAAGATASFGAAASGTLGAGFKLSAAGGVEAALEHSASVRSESSVSGTRAGFGLSGGPTLRDRPSRLEQDRTPLARASHRPGASLQLSPAPKLPRVDKRARTFGRGIPLRERIEVQTARPGEREAARTPPIASNPLQPPWEALPSRDLGLPTPSNEVEAPRPSCGCNCAPSSQHRAPWSIEREEGEP